MFRRCRMYHASLAFLHSTALHCTALHCCGGRTASGRGGRAGSGTLQAPPVQERQVQVCLGCCCCCIGAGGTRGGTGGTIGSSTGGIIGTLAGKKGKGLLCMMIPRHTESALRVPSVSYRAQPWVAMLLRYTKVPGMRVRGRYRFFYFGGIG